MAKTGEKFYERTEGKDGKVHQVVKFNPDGKVLLALGKAGVAETARTHSIDPRPLSLLQATISLLPMVGIWSTTEAIPQAS